ncbi:dipeptide epimerase [Namhaeicola litoreus]|uniref:Dipeptide epimerase n=1 Tax=Namhaeicola litoreus TaxID=1052145 RepID=A0ABW3XZ50_9FLAO
MQLRLRSFDLELTHTFSISRQSFNHKPTLIVELKDGKFSGFGESSENPYYHKTVEMMIDDLLKCKDIIEQSSNETPEEFWQKMYPMLKHDMFALCALDIAFNDLFARKKGVKLYELWDLDLTKNPLTNYTLGIDTIEKMVVKMKETPWPIYKIKLGTKDDIAIVKELRKHSDAIFRIDANCAWGVDETLKNAEVFKTLGVEFIEQPMPAENWDDAKIVYEKSVLPIVADESCQIESDVLKCVGHFHGVNIKLAKCGGITPARRMLFEAEKNGLKKMVGCMTESTVGMSAIAHLLPYLDYVDMDGQLLMKHDIADGTTLEFGKILYAQGNGTGVKLKNISPKIDLK